MPKYEVTILSTFECFFRIQADSKDEAIFEAEQLASDSRTIYLKNHHSDTELVEVTQDEPSEEER